MLLVRDRYLRMRGSWAGWWRRAGGGSCGRRMLANARAHTCWHAPTCWCLLCGTIRRVRLCWGRSFLSGGAQGHGEARHTCAAHPALADPSVNGAHCYLRVPVNLQSHASDFCPTRRVRMAAKAPRRHGRQPRLASPSRHTTATQTWLCTLHARGCGSCTRCTHVPPHATRRLRCPLNMRLL